MTRNNTHPSATTNESGTASSSSLAAADGPSINSNSGVNSTTRNDGDPSRVSSRYYSTGELRDLPRPLRPSWVIPCPITTIHPQLRDLIACPRKRGEVFVVEGKGVKRVVVDGLSVGRYREDDDEESEEEAGASSTRTTTTTSTKRHNNGDEYITWFDDDDDDDDDDDELDDGASSSTAAIFRAGGGGGGMGGNVGSKHASRHHHRTSSLGADRRMSMHLGRRKEGREAAAQGKYWTPKAHQSSICNLSFTPNCITASDRLLACGGQNGELYLATLPTPMSHRAKVLDGDRPAATSNNNNNNNGWALSMTLPHTSINNSFLLLPPYAGGTPLPTRPSSPIPGVSGSSSMSPSASRGNGVATYPNSLPTSAGGSGSRASHRFSFHDLSNPSRHRSIDGGVTDERDRDPRRSGGRILTVLSGSSSTPYNLGSAPRSPLASRIESHPYPRPPQWATGTGTTFPCSSREDEIFAGMPSILRGTPSYEPRLLVSNNDQSIKMFAVRPSAGGLLPETVHAPTRWGDVQQPQSSLNGGGKKLARVGGVRLQTAVNHTSMSPDGKTMLAVGDTNDVHLFETVGGGREFRKIGTYKGSNDAGFSTSWSKDGRKFAVASQDGQVTVWDHRSSSPLAFLYTTPVNESSTSLAGPTASYWDEINNDGYPDVYYSPPPEDRDRNERRIGEASAARIRRDPARAVKFSPEGSNRDLLVFSEEMDHIHIVDARTFATQETIRVPFRLDDNKRLTRGERVRQAVQNGSGRVGISGLTFDPTGDFLYTGTEATLVEFDLRSARKRGIGCSAMA